MDFAFARARLVHANCFFYLRADTQHGIQRRHRLLKNHGDFTPAQLAHLVLRNRQQIFARCTWRAATLGTAASAAAVAAAQIQPRLAPCGSNPINASESIVLPEPDSPTIPSVSPSASVNETSFTGRTHPPGVGSSTVSPRTSRLVAMET